MEKHITDAQIDLWIDGEARGREKESIEAHLMKCPFCRARLEEARALKKVLLSSVPSSLYDREGFVWSRVERSIEMKKCPLRPENFVWPGALTVFYITLTSMITLLMVGSMAGLVGVEVPLLAGISGLWSLLLETIVATALGAPGMFVSLAGSLPGASVWLNTALGIAMEMVLFGGLVGLYVAWFFSFGNNIDQIRRS